MENIFKKISVVLTALMVICGFTRCDSNLLDTTPSYSFSSTNVWSSAVLARAAVTGVYDELYVKYSQNAQGASLGEPFDTWSSVMDVDMNWKNSCFAISGS